jgi:hypothetical protein
MDLVLAERSADSRGGRRDGRRGGAGVAGDPKVKIEGRRKLTKAELRAMGATPGLMLARYSPDGERTRLEEHPPKSSERRRDFIQRFTSRTEDSLVGEGSENAS